MKTKHKKTLLLAAGAFALIAVTAGASTYIVKDMDADKTASESTQTVSTSTQTVQTAAPAQTNVQPQPACDDDNIVGKVIGGAAGGVVGSKIGKGNGKTAATIGGTVGGTLLGEELIPTDNVTCR